MIAQWQYHPPTHTPKATFLGPSFSMLNWIFISFCAHSKQTLCLLCGEDFGQLILPILAVFTSGKGAGGQLYGEGCQCPHPVPAQGHCRGAFWELLQGRSSPRLSPPPLAGSSVLNSILAIPPQLLLVITRNCVSASRFISHSTLHPFSGWNFWVHDVVYSLFQTKVEGHLPFSLRPWVSFPYFALELQNRRTFFGGGDGGVEVFRKGVKFFKMPQSLDFLDGSTISMSI